MKFLHHKTADSMQIIKKPVHTLFLDLSFVAGSTNVVKISYSKSLTNKLFWVLIDYWIH